MMNSMKTLPGEGNSAAFKQFVWLYVNIITATVSALGMNPTYELIYKYAADLDALAEMYLTKWLNKEHPGWENKIQPMDAKTLNNKIMQTGRSVKIIEMVDLIAKEHLSDKIADSLVAILADNKSRYQALINSLFPLLEKLTSGKVEDVKTEPANEDTNDE